MKTLSYSQSHEISSALGTLNDDDLEDIEENRMELPSIVLKGLIRSPCDFTLIRNEREKKIQTVEIMCFLLNWMVLLDCFEDITLQLRTAYTQHLKKSQILDPLFEVLLNNLSLSTPKSFDLSRWDVTEFEIGFVDYSNPISVPLLSAHVYWRCLKMIPSVIRSWYNELKSRQFLQSLEIFTEKYYSTCLIVICSFKDRILNVRMLKVVKY